MDYSKYKTTILPNSRYQLCSIKSESDSTQRDENLIFIPYIMELSYVEALNVYNALKDEYNKKHECCPKCGSEEHQTSLMSYLDVEFKDLNVCVCANCNDVHSTHDRVPKTI